MLRFTGNRQIYSTNFCSLRVLSLPWPDVRTSAVPSLPTDDHAPSLVYFDSIIALSCLWIRIVTPDQVWGMELAKHPSYSIVADIFSMLAHDQQLLSPCLLSHSTKTGHSWGASSSTAISFCVRSYSRSTESSCFQASWLGEDGGSKKHYLCIPLFHCRYHLCTTLCVAAMNVLLCSLPSALAWNAAST